jgi:hypothetical protein
MTSSNVNIADRLLALVLARNFSFVGRRHGMNISYSITNLLGQLQHVLGVRWLELKSTDSYYCYIRHGERL